MSSQKYIDRILGVKSKRENNYPQSEVIYHLEVLPQNKKTAIIKK